jgi:hypothetical protein
VSPLPPHTRHRWASSKTASQLSARPSCAQLPAFKLSTGAGSHTPRLPAPLLDTWLPGRGVSSDGLVLSSSLLISPCDLVSLPEPGPHLLAPRPVLLSHRLSIQEAREEVV